MKNKLFVAFALVVAMMSPLITSKLEAQTVAPGPYYAKPSWDRSVACLTVANCPRFIVLSNMKSEAVLDLETGLVWERSPSTSLFPFASGQALLHCNGLGVGGRRGWRLPSVQELQSLFDADPANPNALRVPPGHPFQNLPSGDTALFWSANQINDGTQSLQFAWTVFLGNGLAGGDFVGQPHFVWCVRGGSGQDIQ